MKTLMMLGFVLAGCGPVVVNNYYTSSDAAPVEDASSDAARDVTSDAPTSCLPECYGDPSYGSPRSRRRAPREN